MKKFFIVFILSLTFLLTGCGVDKLSMLNKRIVERRDYFFLAENDDHYATFVSGMREEPYLTEGTVSTLVPFGIITFQSKTNQILPFPTVSYYIILDGIEYEGELEKSNFDNSYSADIEKLAVSTNNISIRLYYGEFEFQTEMQCVSKDFAIKQEQALQIACDKLLESINRMIYKNTLNAEVYVKIWKDFSSSEKAYFWYVGIVGENQSAGILISAQTGDVLSIKQ